MDKPVSVIGHRGWPTRFPDNTLSGFLAASAIVDMVEMDVRRSADGKLILAHDPLIGGLPVHATVWSELAELDIGRGHRPALLDEVLAAIPGIPAQLEIKNTPGGPGFEPDHRLALEVAERARNGDVVTSFNRSTIEAVRRNFAGVPTGLAVEFVGSIEKTLEYCTEWGHAALVPAAGLVESWVGDALAAGLAVYPWTVNDPDVACELVEVGVSGIITDDPELIARVVRGDM
jgi:glycerophosphoryl diester phosphodiesterase